MPLDTVPPWDAAEGGITLLWSLTTKVAGYGGEELGN